MEKIQPNPHLVPCDHIQMYQGQDPNESDIFHHGVEFRDPETIQYKQILKFKMGNS